MSLLAFFFQPSVFTPYQVEKDVVSWSFCFINLSTQSAKWQPLLFRIFYHRPRNYQSRMIIFVVFFAAVAVLRCAADDSVTTSLLLPAGLFLDASNQKPTFVGQVTVTRRSTTCYTIDCSAGGAASYFYPGNTGCSDNSYTFTEISASTQYLIEDELLASAAATSAAATTSTDATIFITSVSCNR